MICPVADVIKLTTFFFFQHLAQDAVPHATVTY